MPRRTILPPAASVAHDAGGGRLHAPAALRNAPAIADVLRDCAPARGHALELASGTGEHAARFAALLPGLIWQPTEIDPLRRHSIDLRAADAGLPNLRPAQALDATAPDWGANWPGQDLILCVNLLHLISTPEARVLVAEAARALGPSGCLAIYGPFLRGDVATSEGDAAFDAALRAGDPQIGYKSDRDLRDWLTEAGLTRIRQIEMPANNLMLIAYAS